MEQFISLGFVRYFQFDVIIKGWYFDFVIQCCYSEVDWDFVIQVVVFMFENWVLFNLNLNVQIVCWCVMFVCFIFVCKMDVVFSVYFCWDFNGQCFVVFNMIMIMIFVVWIFDQCIVVLIVWIGLLYGKEILMYLYLIRIMIGWIGLWLCIWFCIVIVVNVIFFQSWNVDFFGYVMYSFFEGEFYVIV